MSDPVAGGLLEDADPPGKWHDGSVGGGWISFRLPEGVGVDGFDVPDDEVLELALDVQGDYGDDYRPVEIWVVAYPPDRIAQNWYDAGTTIGHEDDLDAAAEVAAEWMEEHSG